MRVGTGYLFEGENLGLDRICRECIYAFRERNGSTCPLRGDGDMSGGSKLPPFAFVLGKCKSENNPSDLVGDASSATSLYTREAHRLRRL